jgi:hypothetical protein
MERLMSTRQKHCAFCGHFFTFDRRVSKRQRCCSRPECRRTRKRASQEAWTAKNRGYFRGRYDNTRRWLESHPGYLRRRRRKLRDIQDKIPELSPIKSVRLLLPAKWFKSDIQDTMVQITVIDSETYLGTEGEVIYKTRLAQTG